MKFWEAGKQYDTEAMSELELIAYIDTASRLELDAIRFSSLRGCVKELRERIQLEAER